VKPRHVRLPFIDTVDKAHQAVRQINHTGEVEGKKPIVFTTLVNMEVLKVIQDGCKGMLLDMFGTFVHPLEQELGIKSHHRVGRFSDVSRSKEYTTASKPSTSAWPTTTARATATWPAPT
jgi:regulator of PEP synthase PpsR (kinase-PPPase family)